MHKPLAHIARTVRYSPQANQFLDRIPDPGTTRKRIYAHMIDEVVASGVWPLLDFWYVLACDNQADSLINVVSSEFPLAVFSTPAFTPNQGWSGDGANNGYLSTGFTPNSFGRKWAQNSAHFSVWDLTAGDNPYLAIAGDAGSCAIQPQADGKLAFYLNSGSAVSLPVASSKGFSLGNRTSATQMELFKNGASIGSGTNSSSAGGNVVQICRSGAANPSLTHNCAFLSGGAALTSDQQFAFYNAQLHYLLSVGVPNPI